MFDTQNTQLLQELRRGADRAEIYSLSFNNNSKYIAVSSDKGTIHIFSLSERCALGISTLRYFCSCGLTRRCLVVFEVSLEQPARPLQGGQCHN